MSPAEVAGIELIEAVSRRIRQRMSGPDAALAVAFTRRYLRVTPGSEVTGRDPHDVYAATLGHFRRVQVRSDSLPALWITTPSLDEDGWQSPHSVVDVVTDDAPFVVDSVLQALRRLGIGVHLVINSVLGMERDDHGRLVGVHDPGEGGEREALVHLEIDRVTDRERMEALEVTLLGVVQEVNAAFADWPEMRAAMLADAEAIDGVDPEGARLLRWLVDHHFVFLGALLGDDEDRRFGVCHFEPWARAARVGVDGPGVQVDEAEVHASVHRDAPLVRVAVARPDGEGDASGRAATVHCYAGLFTNEVYSEPLSSVPVVGALAAEVVDRAGFFPGGHNERRLRYLLEQYPREELFQIGPDQLFEHAMGMLHLRDHEDVRMFLRRSRDGRSASCLIYVPRDRFDTEVRRAITDVVAKSFGAARTTFSTVVGESLFARLHIKAHAPTSGVLDDVQVGELEGQISRLTRSWVDDLQASLVDRFGEGPGLGHLETWRAAFPATYQVRHRPAQAVSDIVALLALGEDDLAVEVTRPLEVGPDELRIRLTRRGGPLTLSSVLPLLHDLGVTVLEQHPYELSPTGGPPGWVYDVAIRVPGTPPDGEGRRRLEEAFLAVWRGEAESDGFGRLVLAAGLGWREVAVLRAYRRYLRQIGSPFSLSYYEQTLVEHRDVVRLLVELFRCRFDPDLDRDRDAAVAEVHRRLDAALDEVLSLDEDRMLRGFRTLIDATVRTNAFQQPWPDTLAFKLDPSRIPDLPAPRPAHEIWAYSPRVEGVHLRAGAVARGGLRWSDRKEDFRTEVLGLMKAQAVKNSVIVPVGAKGGFVARQLPEGDRDAVRAEVEACYRSFIDAMLDVTDDLVDGQVVGPDRVVRWDGDDPYLVVAADKGTASLSDVANDVAVSRGFWLGDAFASGGRTGYDHKAMGITARGAWESVRRHFFELGVDPDAESITVVGIGDMSGDVFGNGLLRSPHVRLVAAFDHRHVFVDPDPPTEAAFAERRRLYDRPGSSWADYDRGLISPGGGVFERSAKAVEVTPPMATALGIAEGTITPNELVRAVLRAPVDLLWNGGVGTFVKGSQESHVEVGDRTNDAVRVDGDQLRCRVVAEGGNLGMTQAARIEYALAGGRLNTDAIDNSAGVDCSDHEVNLKVLLDGTVAAGDLTVRQRNELLAEMTGEVAAHVLLDNVEQNLALSLAHAEAPSAVHLHRRHLAALERTAGLDRPLEVLPSDDVLAERRAAGLGLTRPELAVVLAYTKNGLTADVLASHLPDSPAMVEDLLGYVPAVVRERFRDRLLAHPLRREIIATVVVNRIVNRVDVTMVHRLGEETASTVADVVRAHRVVWSAFGLEERWQATLAAAGVEAEAQIEVLLALRALGERACRWVLRHRSVVKDHDELTEELSAGVSELLAACPELLTPEEMERPERDAARLTEAGVPADVAGLVSLAPVAVTTLEQVDLAARCGRSLRQVADVWFTMGRCLELGWLREQVNGLPRSDHWQAQARLAARDDLALAQSQLVEVVLARVAPDDPGAVVEKWLAEQTSAIDRYQRVLADIRAGGAPDLAQVSVLLRELRSLILRVSLPAG